MRPPESPKPPKGGERPRHIRDIAHLYMSRRRSPEARKQPPALHVYLTSAHAGCLSGFHAANLAAAFARLRATVRLYELSGLLPNASFYFGHPAALYMNATAHGQRKLLPAAPGVSVAFDTAARPRANGAVEDEGTTLSLYHLPPEDNHDAWQTLDERPRTSGWHVHLANGASSTARPAEELPLHGAFTIDVGGAATVPDASVIDDWRWAVVDRMPIVLRDPRSRLAQAYVATCESLLARMVMRRRMQRVEVASDITRR